MTNTSSFPVTSLQVSWVRASADSFSVIHFFRFRKLCVTVKSISNSNPVFHKWMATFLHPVQPKGVTDQLSQHYITVGWIYSVSYRHCNPELSKRHFVDIFSMTLWWSCMIKHQTLKKVICTRMPVWMSSSCQHLTFFILIQENCHGIH